MRVWNWVERLHDAVALAAERPFDYGGENCALFAAQCVDAIQDGAHWEDALRASFSDAAGARDFMEREGGLEAATLKRLGTPSNWAQAQRGDVCLMPTQDGPALGVCMGDVVAMLSSKGMSYIKIDKALCIWRIE